jgi:putative sterol carrier protein
VVQVSPADLQALLTGQMNPMNAFLSGKLRIHGDMNLALQLQKLFQT